MYDLGACDLAKTWKSVLLDRHKADILCKYFQPSLKIALLIYQTAASLSSSDISMQNHRRPLRYAYVSRFCCLSMPFTVDPCICNSQMHPTHTSVLERVLLQLQTIRTRAHEMPGWGCANHSSSVISAGKPAADFRNRIGCFTIYRN